MFLRVVIPLIFLSFLFGFVPLWLAILLVVLSLVVKTFLQAREEGIGFSEAFGRLVGACVEGPTSFFKSGSPGKAFEDC